MATTRVLILTASSGAGHNAAARAIERAIAARGGDTEVSVVDSLDFTSALFRKIYNNLYIDLVNRAPGVLGWVYDRTDKPWKNEKRRLAIDKFNARRLLKLLHQSRADITICTHFLPGELLSWLHAKGCVSSAPSIVITDFDAHAMWLTRDAGRFFVAIDETREHLARLGIDPSKVTVSGIPIDPEFAVPKDAVAMRRKHGLAPDKFTIMISAGGMGVGPVEKLVPELLKMESPAQLAVICGKSQDLKNKMDRLAASVPARSPVSLIPVGFTREMNEYMAAADLLVGKPGGLTTSEALSRSLPMFIVNPIPGQEERNSDHLLEEGAAVRCNNLPVLPWKLQQLMHNPEKLQKMRAAAGRLGRPRAAFTIAETLLG